MSAQPVEPAPWEVAAREWVDARVAERMAAGLDERQALTAVYTRTCTILVDILLRTDEVPDKHADRAEEIKRRQRALGKRTGADFAALRRAREVEQT